MIKPAIRVRDLLFCCDAHIVPSAIKPEIVAALGEEQRSRTLELVILGGIDGVQLFPSYIEDVHLKVFGESETVSAGRQLDGSAGAHSSSCRGVSKEEFGV